MSLLYINSVKNNNFMYALGKILSCYVFFDLPTAICHGRHGSTLLPFYREAVSSELKNIFQFFHLKTKVDYTAVR